MAPFYYKVCLPQATKPLQAYRLFQTNRLPENFEKVKSKNEILN